MVKDPVCGMMIDPKTAVATREHDGQTFYFCSKDCVDKFDADPHRYGHPEEHEHHNQHNKPAEEERLLEIQLGANRIYSPRAGLATCM